MSYVIYLLYYNLGVAAPRNPSAHPKRLHPLRPSHGYAHARVHSTRHMYSNLPDPGSKCPEVLLRLLLLLLIIIIIINYYYY